MTAAFLVRATGRMELSFIEVDKKWKLKNRRGYREAFAFKAGCRTASVPVNGWSPSGGTIDS